MVHETLADQVVESLVLSQEEAAQQEKELRHTRHRLLFGVWYAEPHKEQIIEDFTLYLNRRPNIAAEDASFIGRAVIDGSDMVGVALWLPPEARDGTIIGD